MKTLTAKSITESEIRSLGTSAGQAGDYLQAAICELALGNEVDGDDWTTLSRSDLAKIAEMDRDEAVATCVAVINDANGRRA